MSDINNAIPTTLPEVVIRLSNDARKQVYLAYDTAIKGTWNAEELGIDSSLTKEEKIEAILNSEELYAKAVELRARATAYNKKLKLAVSVDKKKVAVESNRLGKLAKRIANGQLNIDNLRIVEKPDTLARISEMVTVLKA